MVSTAERAPQAQASDAAIDRRRIGRNLTKFAWAVEILAATISVIIAILVAGTALSENYDAAQSNKYSHVMNAFLGALPFLVVAAVELTKIPLATACYLSSSLLWRIILVAGLLLLMFITFETILNGFERNFTERTYSIKQQKLDLAQLQGETRQLVTEIDTLAGPTRQTRLF